MQRPKILMVDDEEDLMKTLVNRLNKRNFKTTGVLSGEEALETIKKDPFDVVVLDVKMRGIDGIETLRELKKIDPGIEVILLTGHASVDAALDGMKLGAYEFLMKPCKIEELIEKIDGAWEVKTERDKRIRLAEIRKTNASAKL
ncbi:MAG: response regulator [Candidatus Desulfaltia sp.]|nr:response regulator [Candidatus Desulfaltia sp.]